MAIEQFVRSSLPATPWKNGGGLTREITCRPEAAGINGFHWRASIAEITADGSFSVFEGLERVIVLLTGAGVQLQSADGRVDHRLGESLVPFAFSGDDAVHASLLDGVCSDFNVMTRRGTMAADVRIARTITRFEESMGGVLFAARGRWIVTSADQSERGVRSLDGDTGLWWDEESLAWTVDPQDSAAALIVVRTWRR